MERKRGPLPRIEQMMCEMNLTQVGVCCRTYAAKHKAWPPNLRAVYVDDRTISPGIFVCPCAGDGLGDEARERPWEKFADQVGYEYRAPPASITLGGDTEIPMAWDLEEHSDGKRSIVYSSGRVETLDPAAFAAKFTK